MNVLITAGGTRENIDNVRAITNTSTGRLAAAIAEAFAKKGADIFYVCSESAVLPLSKAAAVRVVSARDTEIAISEITRSNSIDIIVHCMAIGDYRTRRAITAENLAELILAEKDRLNNYDDILRIIGKAPSANESGKISSTHDNLMLVMEKTPKVIAGLRNLAPNAVIVGFKLLCDASEERLIDTAYSLLRQNNCDYVLANDCAGINENGHIGYFIDINKEYAKYNTKQEIANGIVETIWNKKKLS